MCILLFVQIYILWINTVPLWSLVLQSSHTLLLFFLCFNMYKDHKAPQVSPGGFWWCGSSTEAIRCQSMELTTNTALWLGCEPTLPKSWGPIPRLSKCVSKDHLRSCVPKSFAGVDVPCPQCSPEGKGSPGNLGFPAGKASDAPWIQHRWPEPLAVAIFRSGVDFGDSSGEFPAAAAC